MRFVVLTVPLVLMLVGLPMAGAALAGLPLATYLEFPPQTTYVAHALFSWHAFAVTALLVVVMVAPFVVRVVRSRARVAPGPPARGTALRGEQLRERSRPGG